MCDSQTNFSRWPAAGAVAGWPVAAAGWPSAAAGWPAAAAGWPAAAKQGKLSTAAALSGTPSNFNQFHKLITPRSARTDNASLPHSPPKYS